MKFYLPKSFTDLVRTAAKLDPTAKPFVPESTGGPDNDRAAAEIRDAVPPTTTTTTTETNPNFAIYNNGVPALTPNSLKDVLDGIGDEALDENFGPDALDAAELEMVDHYVSELATIDLLEDREERARNGFHHIRKRWASRRAHGLSPDQTPRKAVNSVAPSDHTPKAKIATSPFTALAPFYHQQGADVQKKIHLTTTAKSSRTAKSRSLFYRQGHKLIQQPQKAY